MELIHFFIQMVRKNVEKGKLGSAIVGLENKRWITIVSVSGTNWLEWILILILHHHITITIITITIITIRAREYIWLVEAEWPDVRERERMANYRTPSQVLHDGDDADGGDDCDGGAGEDGQLSHSKPEVLIRMIYIRMMTMVDDEDGGAGDDGYGQAVRAAIEKMAEEGEVYTGVFTQVLSVLCWSGG